MLCVRVHGCDPGRVSDGSRLALYQTLSIECPFCIFFCHVLCVIVPLFCPFLFVCFLFLCLCSRWNFVDVPLIFSCPADHVLLPDWQPYYSVYYWVENRSVNVKNTTTTTYTVVHYLEKISNFSTPPPPPPA